MQFINSILETTNFYLYSFILIILLIGAGIYFTIRSKFVQVRMIPEGIRLLKEKSKNDNAVSSFQALMISTASRVGVGNIAGVASAIAIGGAGSVFWMWLIAIIGAASAFVESTLAQTYKIKDGESFRGGPAYYIEKALKKRWLGVTFSVLLIACFAYGFNALQAHIVVSSVSYYFPNSKIAILAVAVLLSAAVAAVIFGGQKKIAFITSVIVPVMALIYLTLGLIIIIMNITAFPEVIKSIFSNAFDVKAIIGAFGGSAVMQGVKRGLFSNEAGMGSAPNAAASADVSHPAKQGIVQMLSVFIDTLLICSTTAFIVLFSGVDTMNGELTAMPLMQAAMASQFGKIGILFITISIVFFAFSSIVGNYYYTESNMIYINRNRKSFVGFRCSVIVIIFIGCIAGADLVWNLADVLMGCMTIVNVSVILLLGSIPMKILRDYSKQKSAGKNPVFKAKDVGLDNTELWK